MNSLAALFLSSHWFDLRGLKTSRCRTLNVSGLKTPTVSVAWKLGEELPTRVSSLSLEHGSKSCGPSRKPSSRVVSFSPDATKDPSYRELNQSRLIVSRWSVGNLI
ncbi:hypothetical protein TNCV_3808211 [Trichonephila clavipes]|nr:hypothetical protein TNCV_3808211 [Trichonephila clavipes]